MNEYIRAFVIPLIVQVLVGLGAASLAITAFNARLEARITHMELRTQEHEQRLEYLRTRTEDQERQLAKLSTLASDIVEIKNDVKSLMRGNRP